MKRNDDNVSDDFPPYKRTNNYRPASPTSSWVVSFQKCACNLPGFWTFLKKFYDWCFPLVEDSRCCIASCKGMSDCPILSIFSSDWINELNNNNRIVFGIHLQFWMSSVEGYVCVYCAYKSPKIIFCNLNSHFNDSFSFVFSIQFPLFVPFIADDPISHIFKTYNVFSSTSAKKT